MQDIKQPSIDKQAYNILFTSELIAKDACPKCEYAPILNWFNYCPMCECPVNRK